MGPDSCELRNGYTATIVRDGEWFIAFCSEISGANGQGRTREACLASLSDAIDLVLEDQNEGACHDAEIIDRTAQPDRDSTGEDE
jgi:predicted RNase H-like HicB family nuclease